jgi:aspartyl/asparaginyl beta-hydroxylase (cupin superfamily)
MERGVVQLRAGQAAAARDSFARLISEGADHGDAHLGLAHAHKRLGEHELAWVALDAALALQPRHIGALVLKGDWLDAAGNTTAASFYQAATRCAEQLDPLPREWAAALEHAQTMCVRYAQRFEQTLRGHLDKQRQSLGSPSARFAQSLDLLVGQRRLYPSAPLLYLFPELPTVQFFERRLFPWLDALEKVTDAIRSELQTLMEGSEVFRPYLQSDASRPALNKASILDNPDWSACFLWKNGQRIDEYADRCPVTESALAELPLVRVPGRSPSVLFSLLRPGAHIPAHHGFVNTRLIVHLPLIAPGGSRFRVGNETREWVEGRAWLFDDTIEHEAWNLSTQTRVVLLFEVWRPELTESERAYVHALFESIDRQRGGVGHWGI